MTSFHTEVIPSVLVTLGCNALHKAGAQQCSPIKLRVLLHVLKLFHIPGWVPRLRRLGNWEVQESGVGLEGSGVTKVRSLNYSSGQLVFIGRYLPNLGL